MSKWSGRHDFADEIEMIGFKNLKNGKILSENGELISEIHNRSDCVPYYPYCVLKLEKTNEATNFYLAVKSWIDIEEEQCGCSEKTEQMRKALNRELKRLKTKEAK